MDRLVAKLSHSSAEVRLAAATSLRHWPGREASCALVTALRRGNAQAAQVLGWRGDRSAIPALVEALSSSEVALHQNARAALVALQASDSLRQVLLGGSDIARHMALRALIELRPDDLPELLEVALQDTEVQVRSLAQHQRALDRARLSGFFEATEG